MHSKVTAVDGVKLETINTGTTVLEPLLRNKHHQAIESHIPSNFREHTCIPPPYQARRHSKKLSIAKRPGQR
jgi:hypothetical protein